MVRNSTALFWAGVAVMNYDFWMKRKVRITGLAILLFSFGFTMLSAQHRINLQKFQTSTVELVFLDKNTSYLVPHTVRSFENALRFHQRFWNYIPSGKTNILFNDFSDVGNGGTMVIPWNFLNIGVSPFDYTFSVVPSNERMQWLMSHELTHQVMCDQSSRSDRLLQKIFLGKISSDNRDPLSMLFSYYTTPRWYSPRWYHEGIAVFMETWMSGGVGRVMGGYDEMVFRTMVRDSAYFYHVIGLETEGTTIDFQVGVNSYLYGTRFISYLAYRYGTEKLKAFYNRTDTSYRFYARQFEAVYGRSIHAEWSQWIEFEHQFQQENLARIRKNPISKGIPLTDKVLGSVSKPCYDAKNQKVYMAVNYPGKLAHIACLDLKTRTLEKIAAVESPALFYVTSIALDDSSGTLFASTHNNDWRGLISIDLKTGKTKKLIPVTRTGGLVFNPHDHCIYGLQSLSGRSTLVRFTPPYLRWEELYTLPYGKDLSDPDISRDGKLLSATLSDVQGRQRLVLFSIPDLLAGKNEYSELYTFEDNNASGFVFSDDGQHLYGTSYFTGVSNVFRISVADPEPEILTNAGSGFFRPLPLSGDSMLVMDYTHQGMLPVILPIDTGLDVEAIVYLGQKIVTTHPEVESWILPPPSAINLDSIHVEEKPYHVVKEIRLSGAYPILQGYKNQVAGGYRFNFMDPMGINSLIGKLSVSPTPDLPEKQQIHGSLDFSYWNWKLGARYNYADFYDLFGPTRFSRAGYSFSAQYQKMLTHFTPDKSEILVKLAMYGDLETLPAYQEVASDFSKIYFGMLTYHWSHLRKSLGAVEPEQGFDWNVNGFASVSGETFYPQIVNNFDFGFLLPLRNSSLWFRTSAGQSFGESDKSNSYFYFGGFGNNYLDFRDIRQYREYLSFPGESINAVPGLNYAKLLTEVNLSPVRFRKAGFAGFYVTYMRAALFGSGIYTNIANELKQETRFNSGVQVDVELVLFSLLKSTLSFGYARGYSKGFPKDEYMVSLKL